MTLTDFWARVNGYLDGAGEAWATYGEIRRPFEAKGAPQDAASEIIAARVDERSASESAGEDGEAHYS